MILVEETADVDVSLMSVHSGNLACCCNLK